MCLDSNERLLRTVFEGGDDVSVHAATVDRRAIDGGAVAAAVGPPVWSRQQRGPLRWRRPGTSASSVNGIRRLRGRQDRLRDRASVVVVGADRVDGSAPVRSATPIFRRRCRKCRRGVGGDGWV